jgi:pullulanase
MYEGLSFTRRENMVRTVKAFVDSYNRIRVEMQNSFYNGETKTLRLVVDDEMYDLDIVKVTKKETHTLYETEFTHEIDFNRNYYVIEDHALRTPVEYRGILDTKKFNEDFFYDGNDLGSTYTSESTTFKLWNPIATKVNVELTTNGETKLVPMEKGQKGVWSVTVTGDLELTSYVYVVYVNGKWSEGTDPYAYTSLPNHTRSVVIDLDKTKVESKKDSLPEFKRAVDAVIYELHVRDYSVANANIKEKGKFLGVVSDGGLNYIKSIGMTHVQFLPMYDFGSVDENNQFATYNWGYDPVQYSVPEGSYSTNPNDPYSRVIELKQMVSKLNEAGIRVNMDVVYNHMFDMPSSAFQNLMPNYYFRLGEYGEISNGSFCGNDLESRNLMVRKFMIDSLKRFVEFYGIDGFRFDLMGMHDIETMNIIRKELSEIDETLMIYGEGWNMPTLMPYEDRACMQNHFDIPEIGHFNDMFRDRLKEFVTGEKHKTDIIMYALTGGILDTKKHEKMFYEPHQSVNYVECHDNETFWDKLLIFNDEESYEMRRYRMRFAAATIMTSQGISFIHAGQEFNRTKNRDHNSYMSPDSVNKFDWERMETFSDDVEYMKGLIRLRKMHGAFRLGESELVKEHVSIKKIKANIIEYQIKNVKAFGPYKTIRIILNASTKTYTKNLRGKYDVFAHDKKASDEVLFTSERHIDIMPLTVSVLMN